MSHLHTYCRLLSCSFGLALAGLLLAGCSTTDSPPPRQAAAPERISELLRVGDAVTISFSGPSEIPTQRHEERIKNDGMIKLPILPEPIQAAGKTRGQLQEDIVTAYVPKYYKHLTVVVTSESRCFYVDGMVKNEGRFPHVGEMTVLRCIAVAGGFNDFAKKTKVQLIRANGKKEKVNCVDAQTHPDKDLPVFPDDRIYVPRRYF